MQHLSPSRITRSFPQNYYNKLAKISRCFLLATSPQPHKMCIAARVYLSFAGIHPGGGSCAPRCPDARSSPGKSCRCRVEALSLALFANKVTMHVHRIVRRCHSMGLSLSLSLCRREKNKEEREENGCLRDSRGFFSSCVRIGGVVRMRFRVYTYKAEKGTIDQLINGILYEKLPWHTVQAKPHGPLLREILPPLC